MTFDESIANLRTRREMYVSLRDRMVNQLDDFLVAGRLPGRSHFDKENQRAFKRFPMLIVRATEIAAKIDSIIALSLVRGQVEKSALDVITRKLLDDIRDVRSRLSSDPGSDSGSGLVTRDSVLGTPGVS